MVGMDSVESFDLENIGKKWLLMLYIYYCNFCLFLLGFDQKENVDFNI